jgi:hypothetical protein
LEEAEPGHGQDKLCQSRRKLRVHFRAGGWLRERIQQNATLGHRGRQHRRSISTKRRGVDSTYFDELAVQGIGDHAEINDTQVTVKTVTRGIRSFTTLPYIFTSLPLARSLAFAAPDQAS